MLKKIIKFIWTLFLCALISVVGIVIIVNTLGGLK